MINAKVYLVETDVHTIVHCGHAVEVGESYYMLRTNAPRWVALCKECKQLLESPTVVKMGDLVHEFEEHLVPAQEKRDGRIKREVLMKREKRAEEELREAEWV